MVLANILRTDLAAHRPLPADSELGQAIAVLARAQQDAVWDRTQAHNKLRSHLREYYPAFLRAFAGARDGIMRPEARVIGAAVPTPTLAAKLTKSQLAALLRRAGRQRGIQAEAARLQQVLRGEQMRQLPLVEDAMGAQTVALLRALDTAATSAAALADATEQAFNQHPDAEIITSLLTASPGARAHYDRRRAAGDRHAAALRNLNNRLLGCLHHCLQTGQRYDEATAFPTTEPEPLAAAA
jgi:hypothetical protein